MAELDKPTLLELQTLLSETSLVACSQSSNINQYNVNKPDGSSPHSLLEFDEYDPVFPGIDVPDLDYNHMWSDTIYDAGLVCGNGFVSRYAQGATSANIFQSPVTFFDETPPVPVYNEGATLSFFDEGLGIYHVAVNMDIAFPDDSYINDNLVVEFGVNAGTYQITDSRATPQGITIFSGSPLSVGSIAAACRVEASFAPPVFPSGTAEEFDFMMDWSGVNYQDQCDLHMSVRDVPSGVNYFDMSISTTGRNLDSSIISIANDVRVFYRPEPFYSTLAISKTIDGQVVIADRDASLDDTGFTGTLDRTDYELRAYIVLSLSFIPDPMVHTALSLGVIGYTQSWPRLNFPSRLCYYADLEPTDYYDVFFYYVYKPVSPVPPIATRDWLVKSYTIRANAIPAFLPL